MPVRASPMPSQLERTSAILGEYMLKGWTLTDLHCEICRSTPLMREPPAEARQRGHPNERIQFCALCDGGPDGTSATPAPAFSGSSGASYEAARRASSYRSSETGESMASEEGEQHEGDRTPPEAGAAPTIEFISPLDPQPPISRSVSTTTTGPTLAALAGGADSMRRSISNSSISSQPPTAPPDRPLPAAPESHTTESTQSQTHERGSTAESSDWGLHSRLSTGASAVRASMATSSSFPTLLPPRRESDGSLVYPNGTAPAPADAARRASAITPTTTAPHFHPFSAYASSYPPSSLSQQHGIPASLPNAIRSERVAQSISSYLERGYSLLSDNCTQATCIGIPLVGYPKRKDGTADGRKMCVSCGGAWVDASKMEGLTMVEEAKPVGNVLDGTRGVQTATKAGLMADDVAALGAGRIVDIPRSAFGAVGSPIAGGESPRSRMRRELYDTGSAINASVAAAQAAQAGDNLANTNTAAVAQAAPVAPQEAGRQPARESITPHTAKVSSTILPTQRTTTYTDEAPLPFGPVDEALDKASAALSHTLAELSTTLTQCTMASRDLVASAAVRGGQGNNAPFVDIKLHTEAMKDVLTVLEQVGRMERAREMKRRVPGPRGGPIPFRATGKEAEQEV